MSGEIGRIYIDLIGGVGADEQPELLTALAKAYRLGIERAREAVNTISYVAGSSPNDGVEAALEAINDALTEAPETEGGE